VSQNKSRNNSVFPIQEIVLNQIRHDVILKDIYQGRFVDKKMTGKGLPNSEIDVLNQSLSTQELQVLTQQGLVELVKDLARSVSSTRANHQHSSILQVIENECCSRVKNWDSANLLLIADAFFVLRYRCSRYFSAMFREFEHRWSTLLISKVDVVQLALCVVISRKFPLLLSRNIEDFVNTNSGEFSASELSVICSAFFMTNTSLRNVEVMDKIANAVLYCLPNGDLKVYQLGTILKALRHAHFSKLSFYDSLGSALSCSTALQNESILNDLANIAFAYASMRISSQTLFAAISSNAVRLIRHGSHMRVKDVGRLVWSFALLREPVAKVVQDQLVFMLRCQMHVMEQFPQAFVESLSGLAMLEVYPVDLLQKLFSMRFPKEDRGSDGKVNSAVLYCVIPILSFIFHFCCTEAAVCF